MKTSLRFSVISFILTLFFVCSASAQAPIIGKWKTIDDETNEPKSIVEIFEKDGKYYGKIVQLIRKPGEDPNPICDDCKEGDDRKNQPIIGMEIIRDLVPKSEKFSDGTILDPKDGKVYDCKLWVKDGALQVRAYIAFFFRTQTWHKVD